MDIDSLIKQCAQMIHQAKRMVFLTSAGMSADSNIPTFRDKEGYWSNFPPFREKGLEAQDLASPWAFRNELPHAWAFYEWRRRNAHENQPHAGYTIINKWIEERLEDAFIHTTNTDGYHLRSGCSPDQVKEVHGSMWRLQCLNVCSPDFWDEDTVPLCDLDHDTMKASNYPTCPHCGGIARPHILMFGDGEYTGHPEQERNFQAFARRAVDLVILVGSSGAVPTNDYLAKEFMRAGAETLNINLDPSANAIVGTEYFLPLKGKEAFERLDEALQTL